MKNKKGFTLIELLAVIIILGILMIIAIPSVTKYISDSRKSAYIKTANQVVAGARNLVNEGKLEMYDTNTVYYIPSSCIKTENSDKVKSPYGEFVIAYVAVTYDGKGYSYYWTSVDDAGQGVKNIVSINDLDEDDIESDVKQEDIKVGYGIDGRRIASVLNDSSCNSFINSNAKSNIDYNGKTIETLSIGDEIKIGSESFYVFKIESNKLYLLTKYNLKVGSIYRNIGYFVEDYTGNEEDYGIQNSEVRAFTDMESLVYGSVPFATRNYFDGSSNYSGNNCTNSSATGCKYIYDSNSILYEYVENYKKYIESLGVNVDKARLMSLEEGQEFKNNGQSSKLYLTTFWLGTARSSEVWAVRSNHLFAAYSCTSGVYNGVRPVLEVLI